MRTLSLLLAACLVPLTAMAQTTPRATPRAVGTPDPCATPSGASDTITSGRPPTITWLMAAQVPVSPTDPTLVAARIDGFYLAVDGGAKADIGKPASVSCPNNTLGFQHTSATGYPRGNHTATVSAWNFVLDATGTPTTTRQEGAVTTRPFVAVDPVAQGPPPAPGALQIWK